MTRRILVVSPYRSQYGPGQVLDHVVRGLLLGGYEPVCVIPEKAPLTPTMEAHGVRVHRTSTLSTFPRTFNAFRLRSFLHEHAAAARFIEEMARAENASLVYSTSEAILCGGIAARRAGLPSIVHAIGMSIGSPHSVASVYIRLLDRVTDQFVACSSAVAEMFEAHGVDDSKTVVIHNGIDVAAIDATTDVADLPGGPGKVGMIAGYDPRKGHRLFLEAAALIAATEPTVTFFLVGGVLSGQRESADFELHVRDLIRDRGLDGHVVQTGFVAPPSLYATVRALDVVVVPSATEAFAHALLEGMACGRPVVATRIEGNLDALIDRESGIYVDRDPRELADAVLSLLRDPARAEAMGAAARERVRSLFDLELTLPPIAQVLEIVLRAPPRPR